MIIGIFGTNASGKTSVAKELIGAEYSVLKVPYDEEAKTTYGITLSEKICAFGSYDAKKKMGGADVESVELIKKIEHFLENSNKQPRIALIEGSVIAYPKNVERFRKCHSDTKIVILTAKYHTILKRLALRNDKVKYYKGVLGKIKTCDNLAKYCRENRVEHLYLDTSVLTLQEVCEKVKQFLYGNTK